MYLRYLQFILMFSFNQCFGKKYYNNYKLYRGFPINQIQLDFFKNLEHGFHVNFWKFPSVVQKPVDFAVGPKEQHLLLMEAERRDIYLTTLIEDIQKAFDLQTVNTYTRRKIESFHWHDYFRLQDIYQWLRDLTKLYSGEMQLLSIGKTHENRDILAVRIYLHGCKLRSNVIVEGGIHAREWISPAFVTYMIYQILSSSTSDNEALKNISITYQWFFVPILNPDGYEYSHTQDRMWRKNRHNVDLNRNFESAFGTVGVSKLQFSEVYCGTYALSEKETSAMARFIRSKSEDLEYYLSFHSYGQYIIIPYSYSSDYFDNYFEVQKMCEETATKIAVRYKTRYIYGNAYSTVGYRASGTSPCWVKRTFRVPYVVTFELRDKGYTGFALPPNQIIPTCLETMDGVISFLTPQSTNFSKMQYEYTVLNGQNINTIDLTIVICCMLLSIKVNFDRYFYV